METFNRRLHFDRIKTNSILVVNNTTLSYVKRLRFQQWIGDTRFVSTLSEQKTGNHTNRTMTKIVPLFIHPHNC